jgi:shikimate kinase
MTEEKLPKKTDRIFLAGFMGSGKSAVGRVLARKLRRRFADLDDAIVREAGMPIPEIFRLKGEAEFRKIESGIAATYSAGKWVVALGGGTLLDPVTRKRLMDSGVVVYLRAGAGTLAARLCRETDHRPLLAGAESLEGKVRSLMETRNPIYSGASWIIDTDDLSVEQVAALIFNKVRKAGND